VVILGICSDRPFDPFAIISTDLNQDLIWGELRRTQSSSLIGRQTVFVAPLLGLATTCLLSRKPIAEVLAVVLDDSRNHISRSFFSLARHADSLRTNALSAVRHRRSFGPGSIGNTTETNRADLFPKSTLFPSTQKEAATH